MQVSNIYQNYITPKQASVLLQNSTKTVINLCKTEQLKHAIIGGKYYINKNQFNKWRVKC